MPAPKGNDYAKGNDGGRPSKFNDLNMDQVRTVARRGWTDIEMAEFFDVSDRTWYRWKVEHEEFCDALKEWKAEADERVERSLFERAVGYSHPEDKVFNNGGEALVVPTVKHYPPDTTAGIFWLKNRDKERWKDKQEVEVSGGPDLIDRIARARARAQCSEK